ncbi:3-oxoacyl-reductase [Rhodotorula diobovata]|uniref:3-oxoacyl-reductase n=1 Tax=Rhodotorula diobovata TaxID=5288 RepID=A0A5C5FQJ1_9BASI|nr:3-oxoacyl-reductase [Rhodotorula diobovata]
MSARRFPDFLPSVHATTYPFISPTRLDLSGRTVIVTGGALVDGIGFAAALAFARAGAAGIAILDQHSVADELVAQLKHAAVDAGRTEPQVVTHRVDITSLAAVQAARDAVLDAFSGRLDVLVNNAAFQEPYAPLLDADPATYWRTWEVNVGGLFNMARAFLPALLAARSLTEESTPGLATMLNVSSSGALSARPGGGSYRTSKLAILRWTESLQLDYGTQGLLAFCVNPGAVRTQITVNEPSELRDRLPHKPDLPGDTIVWLVSSRREWLAGRYVSCPWDMEELVRRQQEIVEGDKLKVRLAI